MSPAFVAKCDDYTSKPFRTREDAERWIARVEAAGHCQNDHTVEEVPVMTGTMVDSGRTVPLQSDAMSTSTQLRRAARAVREATERRDALIRQRVTEEHASLRIVGAEADMSHTQVGRIVAAAEPGDPTP